MSEDFFAGIDVAGKERGFQVAILPKNTDQIMGVIKGENSKDVADSLEELQGDSVKIAIDSPPKAHIDIAENDVRGGKTRLAERQLNNAGYNVQWTPREKDASYAEWMKNGEELWDELRERFSEDKLIETFPTASLEGLTEYDVSFPISLIDTPDKRKEAKDYFDAAVCALVAREVSKESDRTKTYGKAGMVDKYDDSQDDVLGNIHVLDPSE